MPKTVIGLFDDMSTASDVVEDLVQNGIPRSDLSLVAPDAQGPKIRVIDDGSATAEAGTGAALGGLAGVVAGIATLAIPGVGAVLAVGPLTAALAGAGVGAAAGGLIGALQNAGLPEAEAESYSEGVSRGGVLVSVNASDRRAEMAADIMDHHGAVDIEKRVVAWRENGWKPQHDYLPPRMPDDVVQTGRIRSEGGGARVFVW